MGARIGLNLIFSILPSTRFFPFKRLLLSFYGVDVGAGSKICGGLRIYGRSPVVIGESVWLGLNSCFYLSPNSKVVIGDNCDIAPNVVFHTGSHYVGGAERRAGPGYGSDIIVGCGVWIGFGVNVLPGCTVGDSSIVAAGAVLLGKDYPSNSLIGGVPARVIKKLS